MKRILFLVLLNFANYVFAEAEVTNKTSYDILVNVHDEDGSYKATIKPNEQKVVQRGTLTNLFTLGAKLEYISIHFANGPFKGLGARLEIGENKYKEITNFNGVRVNLKRMNYSFEITIQNGLPAVKSLYQLFNRWAAIDMGVMTGMAQPRTLDPKLMITDWRVIHTSKEEKEAIIIIFKMIAADRSKAEEILNSVNTTPFIRDFVRKELEKMQSKQ
jgi:hypothetical protein